MKPVRRSCKKGPGDFALTLVEERQRELKRSQLEGQTEEAVQDNWDFELSDWNTMELTRGTTRKHSWQAFIHMDQCTLHIGVMILQCCPHKIYQLVTMSVDQRVLFFILIREVPLSVSLSPFTLKKKKKDWRENAVQDNCFYKRSSKFPRKYSRRQTKYSHLPKQHWKLKCSPYAKVTE